MTHQKLLLGASVQDHRLQASRILPPAAQFRSLDPFDLGELPGSQPVYYGECDWSPGKQGHAGSQQEGDPKHDENDLHPAPCPTAW